MAMVNPMLNLGTVKDSRWLTLEVCREFQRSKCSRTENECKFAHPPPHVEIQNGRVTACFDSIKGKCQRKEPPCKYLHPPQHLKEQLLQNGRNNLILRNLHMQAVQSAAIQPIVPGMVPTVMYEQSGSKALAYPTMLPGQLPFLIEDGYGSEQYISAARQTHYPQTNAALAQLYYNGSTMMPTHPYLGTVPTSVGFNPYTCMTGVPTMSIPSATDSQVSQQVHGVVPASSLHAGQQKLTRPDRLESSIHGMMPYAKRMAIADTKSGVPMYQPGTALPYQQALAAMQLQQQPYIPITFAGHPPSMQRF